MFATSLTLEIIAFCFLFLLSAIWSQENVRFGYVLVPLMAGFFWWSGFLPFNYLVTVIPLMVFMGIFSFMRAQLKFSWGFMGTGGGIIYKMVLFLIIIQMVIGYVNGMGIFQQNVAVNQTNEYTTYTLANANASFSQSSSHVDALNAVTNGLFIAWTLFGVLWSMLASVFFIYPTLVGIFHIPESLSLIVQCGIYFIYALELVGMVYRPYKPVEA